MTVDIPGIARPLKITVHGLLASVKCTLNEPKCSNCLSTAHWTGDNRAIHRWSNSTAITYEVYQAYIADLRDAASPSVNTFVKKRRETHITPGCPFISVDTFRTAFWSLIRALDVPYTTVYTCESCGSFETAPILIGDAKAIVCQPSTSESTDQPSPCGPVRSGSLFEDRVFIDNYTTRELILRYTDNLKRLTTDRAPFDAQELPTLYAAIGTHATFLTAWINAMESTLRQGNRRAPHVEFLGELAYNTSIDGGLIKHATKIRPILLNLSNGSPITHPYSTLLKRYFPALHRLFKRDIALTAGLPPYMLPVINRIYEVSDNLRHTPLSECQTQTNVHWHPILPDEDMRVGYAYPCATEQRPSNVYRKETRRSDYECRKGACNKKSHRFLRVMPGVFAVFCAHGLCLGFHFMNNWESPETFFSLLIQRRRNAPRVIIYDAACRLHSYAMNREPWFFKDTEFYSDRLHWYDHVGCSVGFCIDRFPLYDCLNSEVAEQMFALLDRITTPVSFMGLENATYYVRLFFALQNIKRVTYWASQRTNIQAQLTAIELLLAHIRS